MLERPVALRLLIQECKGVRLAVRSVSLFYLPVEISENFREELEAVGRTEVQLLHEGLDLNKESDRIDPLHLGW